MSHVLLRSALSLVSLCLLNLPDIVLAVAYDQDIPIPCTPPAPLVPSHSPQDAAIHLRSRLVFAACTALGSPHSVPPKVALDQLLGQQLPPVRSLLAFSSRFSQVPTVQALHFGDIQYRPGAYTALYLGEGIFLRMTQKGTSLCDLYSLELEEVGFYRPFPELEAADMGLTEAELRMLLQLSPAGIARYRPWPEWKDEDEPLADRPPAYFPLGVGLGVEAGTYANYLIGPRLSMKLPFQVRTFHAALVGTGGLGRTPPDVQDLLRPSHHDSPFWGVGLEGSWTPTARWRAHPELGLGLDYRMVDILEDPDSPSTKLRRSVVLLSPGLGLWWNNGLRLNVSLPVGWDGLWWPYEGVSGGRPPAIGLRVVLDWHFSRPL